MIEVLILAVALSMDAFAVSIGLGAKHNNAPQFNVSSIFWTLPRSYAINWLSWRYRGFRLD
jgi:hypothetical protein